MASICKFNLGADAMGWKLAPGTRYVLSDSLFRTICEGFHAQLGDSKVAGWSCFNSYERRYGGQDLNGRRLFIYRENGMGDNLIITALTGYLKETYPTATIDVYGLPRVGAIWHGNTSAQFYDVPPTFDAVTNGYDYHLFFEGFMENNSEPERHCAYDDIFSFAGIFPKSVPSHFKRPQVHWTAQDAQCETDWKGLAPKEPYFLIHWNPSGATRQYPFDQYRKVVTMLADYGAVVVIGDQDQGQEPLGVEHPRVLNMMGKTPSARTFLPMIKHAKAVVCPDSCVMHMSGCFPDVPTIALYGPFAHHDRTLYFPNVIPLDAHSSCPSSPCLSQRSQFPVERCKQAQGWTEGEKFCRALSNIPPEKIVETVLKHAR